MTWYQALLFLAGAAFLAAVLFKQTRRERTREGVQIAAKYGPLVNPLIVWVHGMGSRPVPEAFYEDRYALGWFHAFFLMLTGTVKMTNDPRVQNVTFHSLLAQLFNCADLEKMLAQTNRMHELYESKDERYMDGVAKGGFVAMMLNPQLSNGSEAPKIPEEYWEFSRYLESTYKFDLKTLTPEVMAKNMRPIESFGRG